MYNEITFFGKELSDMDKRLSRLDDFNDFYGWKVYINYPYYILYDMQTNEILDIYKSKEEIINRICGRALDYYVEEYEWENNKLSLSSYEMISELLFIYSLFAKQPNDRWFDSKMGWLKSMEIA